MAFGAPSGGRVGARAGAPGGRRGPHEARTRRGGTRCARGNQRRRRRGGLARAAAAAEGPGPGGLNAELEKAIDAFVEGNKVVLFMKGTKQFPQCGFSNTCVMILNEIIDGIRVNSGVAAAGAASSPIDYETVNVLDDDSLRSGMKIYSSWPTFPQLYVDGEFVGAWWPRPRRAESPARRRARRIDRPLTAPLLLAPVPAGGCDIVIQSFQSGELVEMIEKAFAD